MKEFFTKNVRLKLLSLTLALSLEIYFISPRNSVTHQMRVAVELSNLPPTLMVVSPQGAAEGLNVEVKVRGPGPLIQQLESQSQRFMLTLPNTVPSSYSGKFNPAQLTLPSGVEVVEINPPQIEFRFERIVRKELYVDVDTSGEPPKGYQVESKLAIPPTVVARGPESELRGPSEVRTHKIDISNLRASQTFETPLIERGPLTTLQVNQVLVEINVTPQLAEREFDGLKLQALAPAGYAVTVDPPRLKMTLSGPVAELDALDAKKYEMPLDLTDLGPGKHQLDIMKIALPKGMKVLKATPGKITVNLVSK